MSIYLLLLIISVAGFPSCFAADRQYEECRLPLRCGYGPSSVFPNITYPFWGNSIGKPNFCGQTEFELSCKENQNLTIEMGNLIFRVVSANLDDKTITVADESLFEGGCPKILNFNGDGQFTLNPTTEKIDIFDCSGSESYNPTTSLSSVTCRASHGERKTYHVFPSNVSDHDCQMAGEVPMLRSVKNALHESNITLREALEAGFKLRYNIQDRICRGCSDSGGICGSELDSGNFRCLCADKPHKISCNDDQG